MAVNILLTPRIHWRWVENVKPAHQRWSIRLEPDIQHWLEDRGISCKIHRAKKWNPDRKKDTWSTFLVFKDPRQARWFKLTWF